MIIRIEMLKSAICKAGESRFEAVFPEGMELTPKNILVALNAGLDVDIAIHNTHMLVSDELYSETYEAHSKFAAFLLESEGQIGYDLYYSGPREGFAKDEEAQAETLRRIEEYFPSLKKMAQELWGGVA